jgi:RNA polymerase sigma-70 factor (ECF subfamily)
MSWSKLVTEHTTTSLTLLGRVRNGEQQAWDRLVSLYQPLVYRWARLAELQDSDAVDVVQDVFVVVHEHLATFRKDEVHHSFRGWLWGITHHKISDQLRRKGKQPAVIGGSDAQWRLHQVPAEVAPEPDSELKQTDDTILIRRALELVQGEFEPRTWQACVETSVHGRRAADVAADLGMTTGAVYIAKSRVLRRLRDELQDLL